MHKLKLPLLFTTTDGSGFRYTVSKGSEDNKVDLTSADSGTIYKNHCEEARALELFKDGTWVVVGAKKVSAELTDELSRATYDVAKANERLAAAALAVDMAGRPYLA